MDWLGCLGSQPEAHWTQPVVTLRSAVRESMQDARPRVIGPRTIASRALPIGDDMNEQALLSVRGEAVLEVDPEIADITLTVAARDPDRAKALRLLNDRATAIDAILKGFGQAIEKIETTVVRVSPQLKNHRPQERISGYVATIQQRITVVDFARLGELLGHLADQDLTEVAGPWWALRPDSLVQRTARINATHDAVRRARDYAHALGSELTSLVELADTRLLSDSNGPAQQVVMAAAGGPMRTRQAAAPDELTFDIVPARQIVYATVEARFRIAPPDLTAVDPPSREEA
ncbi:MAG: uncharacterized protein QOG97_1884 [Acidimicrobiaceae bacterium]|nr:uncharacterized protein [Acidimicrobiaceae bacterium]